MKTSFKLQLAVSNLQVICETQGRDPRRILGMNRELTNSLLVLLERKEKKNEKEARGLLELG